MMCGAPTASQPATAETQAIADQVGGSARGSGRGCGVRGAGPGSPPRAAGAGARGGAEGASSARRWPGTPGGRPLPGRPLTGRPGRAQGPPRPAAEEAVTQPHGTWENGEFAATAGRPRPGRGSALSPGRPRRRALPCLAAPAFPGRRKSSLARGVLDVCQAAGPNLEWGAAK